MKYRYRDVLKVCVAKKRAREERDRLDLHVDLHVRMRRKVIEKKEAREFAISCVAHKMSTCISSTVPT